MYSSFDRWETATESALRIYDPFAYRPTVFERIVPVCLSETLRLAERWPIMWRRNDHGDPELVVLRSLTPDAEVPEARTQSRTSLPLLLQAFPFRYHGRTPGDEIGIDRAAPMHERDAGSYILDERGNLLPGAELKIRALETWGAELETRALLTETVFRHGLIEPVTLPDNLSAKFVLPEFFTVLPAPEDGLIFGALPREQWLMVARFLAAQRLSLYTMARLIALTGTTV